MFSKCTDVLVLCELRQTLFQSACSDWSQQILVPIEQEAIKLAELFREEAEKLRRASAQAPMALYMATEMFLSLGDLVQGKDDANFRHLSNATLIGVNLCLFGVPEDIAWAALSRATPEEVQANMHPTWGAFNWTV